uniref:Uncharacterized protein n=1 Tax=Ralstonia solanacearum TaxID=305 RepID=A0A0S4UV04_RALSL|nr:protein of unknown function [Ralstonia solanacearum]CUV36023.1 protein of unknown function [Ralstonia solanacearum]CUV37879.1 protein of unknown function [Ralstonia solanacearum]CUV60194.1 protein of unknown function [Ralstonia solanacearum]
MGSSYRPQKARSMHYRIDVIRLI